MQATQTEYLLSLLNPAHALEVAVDPRQSA
jgi:hypothetical protein